MSRRAAIAAAVAALITGAVLAAVLVPRTTSERRVGLDAVDNPDRAAAQDAAPGAYEPLYQSSNTDGRAGSGVRAVAYHAGGRKIDDPSVAAAAPESRLWRTGFGGWEPTLGMNGQGTIFFDARNTNVSPGVVRSRDGGRTWQPIAPASHRVSLDPFMWVDPTTGRLFDSDIGATVTCPPVSYSDDQGSSWTDSVVCGHADYQKIFGGPAPAGGPRPSGYPDVVYFCAITGNEGAGSPSFNQCSRTLDGGKSWTFTASPSYPVRLAPAGSPAPNCDGAAPPGVVDSKGTVYLPRGWCGEPWLAISHDEGDSWTRIRIAGKPLPYDSDAGAWANDSGVAVDSAGDVFYTWVANDFHPYLTVSRDGGKTWSAPLDILPPGVTRTQNPAIDVGANGKLAIEFIGSANPAGTPDDELTWNGYIAISADALDADPTFYAAPVNDPKTNALWKGPCGSPIRCGNMGDFYDVIVGPDGVARAAFVDSCPNGDQCTAFGVTDPRGEAVMGELIGPPALGARPAARCRTRTRTRHVRLRKGRATIRVRLRRGRAPLPATTVRVRGPGFAKVKQTGARGRATFNVRARRRGRARISTPACGARLSTSVGQPRHRRRVR